MRKQGSERDHRRPRGLPPVDGARLDGGVLEPAAMSVTDELLANNARYAATFPGPLPSPPAKHVAVVACMDARLNVYSLLGLHEGEAHVIRNAGGVVTDDVIRSLAISERHLGIREVILIHHTDCGMTTFTDAEFKQELRDDTGAEPSWPVEAFRDPDGDVRRSIERLRTNLFVPYTDAVRGFVLDVTTGRLNEVV
jgi:carbonic anhydrase